LESIQHVHPISLPYVCKDSERTTMAGYKMARLGESKEVAVGTIWQAQQCLVYGGDGTSLGASCSQDEELALLMKKSGCMCVGSLGSSYY